MNQLLELGFLFGVVGCLVLAAASVRKGPANLLLHRIAFLIAIAACVFLATGFVRWYAALELGQRKWEVESMTGPLWWPPSLSSFTSMSGSQEPFSEEFQLPPPDTPGLTITRTPSLRQMVGNLLFYLWWVLLLFGTIYFIGRGDKRDLLLHCGVGIWSGLTTAAALTYIVIPTILRNQPGDPVPLGCAGVLCGIAFAAFSWKDQPK
jgi:hypothetical protein